MSDQTVYRFRYTICRFVTYLLSVFNCAIFIISLIIVQRIWNILSLVFFFGDIENNNFRRKFNNSNELKFFYLFMIHAKVYINILKELHCVFLRIVSLHLIILFLSFVV